MIVQVVNKELTVGGIRVGSVSASSLLLIGDAETINCGSREDTWESALEGPPVPLEGE